MIGLIFVFSLLLGSQGREASKLLRLFRSSRVLAPAQEDSHSILGYSSFKSLFKTSLENLKNDNDPEGLRQWLVGLLPELKGQAEGAEEFNDKASTGFDEFIQILKDQNLNSCESKINTALRNLDDENSNLCELCKVIGKYHFST